MPLAALIARAAFFDDRGNSVPAVKVSGPSVGGKPRRGTGRDSMPSRHTGQPPSRASSTTAVSASAIPAQRSSVTRSWSASARITVLMSNAFLRSGLLSLEKISPTVRKSLSGEVCGYVVTSRSSGSDVSTRRGPDSPGTTYVWA